MDGCLIPPELTEDELSDLIDGESDQRVRDHVERCPYCAERLARAQQVEVGLSTVLFRKDCPSSYELAQFAQDMLDSVEDKARIEGHLETCPFCRQDLKDWQAFVEEEDAAMMGQTETQADNVVPMPVQSSGRIVLFPEIVPGAQRALRGDTRVKRVIANADTTTIRLSFEALPDDSLKLSIQLASQEVDWRGGMVTVQQHEQTVAVCRINDYLIGTCDLPEIAAISLRFVAADETLIEFNDVSP